MKRVVGISLGSSQRDHAVNVNLLGVACRVERVGTDGDIAKMIAKIKELDGEVDAFGLGGISLYIYAVDRRYEFREARKIVRAARRTPIVDGSGLKNTLERRAIEYLSANTDLFRKQKKVLMTSAMDRLGMAQALEKAGCSMAYGDVAFVLNLPVTLKSLKQLALAARLLAPFVVQMPFSWIYPIGDKQKVNKPRHARFFHEADIIAGDFHFIRRYMPTPLPGKTIITNTVTGADLQFLRECRLKTLVTTTPEMEGRSFGTNIMEALLVCLAGSSGALTEQNYNMMLDKLNLAPRIVELQE